MACEIVPVPGGAAFVCGRGSSVACRGIGVAAVESPAGWRCGDARCNRLVDTYETGDGRHVAIRHTAGVADRA